MDDTIHHSAELTHFKGASLLGRTGDDTREEPSVFLNDPDTILSVIVLLLVCLGLAALAHVFV